MHQRIGKSSVVLLLCVAACADIWQFPDFRAVRDDAAADSAVEDDGSSAADARLPDDATADVDAGSVGRGTDAGGADDVRVEVDAAYDQAAPVCSTGCPAGAICDNGVCVCRDAPNLCQAGCFDFQTDSNHCGSCTVACASGAACVAGACACPVAQPSMCAGACVAIESDHANCGGCGNACAASSACHNGMCTKCGSFLTDNTCGGVCVDESKDAKNCGGCGHVCASGAACVGGVCGCPPGDPTTCASPSTDAGACVDTATDHSNCGGCGNVCNLAQATSGCSAKSCVILSCATGFTDCNMSTSDGCETHTAADPNNCSACRKVCTFPHANAGCNNSTCHIQACATGYANCDGVESTGCEVDVRSDSANCGACSTPGASHACTGGKECVTAACTCPQGTHDCSGTCVSDKSMSISMCGTRCTPCVAPTHGSATCSGLVPVCGEACDKAAYPTLCGNDCVDTMSDTKNCGGCGAPFACAAGDTCVAGVCTMGMTVDAGADAPSE